MDREPSDAQLVAACRAGLPGAWADLHKRHGPNILKAVRVTLRGVPGLEAEDLFQAFWSHVMEDGGRRLAGYDPARPLAPYLGTIALNLCRKSLVREAARGIPLEALAEEPEQKTKEDAEGLERLHEGMRALAPRDRLVLRLSAIEGLPPERIADILGVAPASVHVLAGRAREQLRRRIKT